ncbi:hypothetical protein D3C84_727150 [compost metagenome]
MSLDRAHQGQETQKRRAQRHHQIRAAGQQQLFFVLTQALQHLAHHQLDRAPAMTAQLVQASGKCVDIVGAAQGENHGRRLCIHAPLQQRIRVVEQLPLRCRWRLAGQHRSVCQDLALIVGDRRGVVILRARRHAKTIAFIEQEEIMRAVDARVVTPEVH